MATVSKVEDLSSDDRKIVVAALELKMSSVMRAAKSESNSAVAELRQKEYATLLALANRFS